jgi:hypothetical protein
MWAHACLRNLSTPGGSRACSHSQRLSRKFQFIPAASGGSFAEQPFDFFGAALNRATPGGDPTAGLPPLGIDFMKIALFALLGLVLGAIGDAALGVGAGLAWVEIFKTTGF